MKKLSTRILAMVMCVLMCASLLPLSALAATAPETVRESPAVFNSIISNGKPKITTQPKSQSVKQGAKVTFKVAATGGNLKYQWYFRKASSNTWTKLSGATRPTLTITVQRWNGRLYRCKVTNKSGSVYSKSAKLTVNYVKYRALCICQCYDDIPEYTLPGLNDAAALSVMFNKAKVPMGEKYDEVNAYKDLSAYEIEAAIRKHLASKADKNDVSLFYFSGHGDSDSTGAYAGALCTDEGGELGALKLSTLASWLKTIPGKVIVLIDSCGSGAAVYSNGQLISNAAAAKRFNQAVVDAFAAADESLSGDGPASNTGELRKTKFVVLTSSAYQENSSYHMIDDETPVSHFTYWLCDGVIPYGNRIMDADYNGDHIATVKELYNYIKKHNSADNYMQHVQMYASDGNYGMFKS